MRIRDGIRGVRNLFLRGEKALSMAVSQRLQLWNRISFAAVGLIYAFPTERKTQEY